MIKKILFLLTFLLTTLGGGKVYAFRYVITWHDGEAHQYRNDGGSGNFFVWDSGKHNINPKFAAPDNKPSYTDVVYGSITFAYGLKMESNDKDATNETSVDFTITGTSTLTILKSTHSGSSGTIKLHNNTTNADVGTEGDTDTGNGYKEIRIEGLAAGSYSIKRGSGESGLLYVRVTDDANMTMAVNATDLMYGSYDGNHARIQVTDEFAYVEPATYSYSGNTWLRMKLNCSTALSAVTDVTLSSSKPSVITTDDTSHDYFVNSDNLAVYYFVKVVGYSSDPVTITFTHNATSSTTSKSFTVNPGTMTAYNNSYPYKWDFQNNEWTSTRLQTTGDGTNWSVTADEARNKGNISSSTVNMIKGLSFTAGAGGICLDWTNHCLWMAEGTTVVIPNLSIGQVVTVNANKSFTANNSTRMDNNKFYVTTTGDLTLTAPAEGVYVYSIDVSATGQAQYGTTSDGVFQFTSTGALAGGTVIRDVPGIELTIGKAGEAWEVINDDSHGGIESRSTVGLARSGYLPTSGSYYTFTPRVSGFLTISGSMWGNHDIILSDGTSEIEKYHGLAKYDNYTFTAPLVAGNTYYLYNATEDLTNGWYKFQLHSFSYEPAFLNTSNTARQTGTFAAIGSTTEFPSILTDANEYVTFAATGGAPNDAITVEANGNGTPTLVQPTTSPYTITATVASPNSSVTSKTDSYQLSYTATAITLGFQYGTACNTNYEDNKTYTNAVTAMAGEDNVTNEIETWTYTSDNESIATVAADGTLTIHNSGLVKITVTATDTQGTYQSATASYWLTINTTVTPTLSLSNGTDNATIKYGNNYTNVGTVKVGSSTVEGPTITYESSNTSVAAVSESGVVTGVVPSSDWVTITVRSSQYKQYASATETYMVKIEKNTVRMNFLPGVIYLNPGEYVTPYLNLPTLESKCIESRITVSEPNGDLYDAVTLENPAYVLSTKVEGTKTMVDRLNVKLTGASHGQSTDQEVTVRVTINSDYYEEAYADCKVIVRAAANAKRNFQWDGQAYDAVPEYVIYQGDFMLMPAIAGNCSHNNSYSNHSTNHYVESLNANQSVKKNASADYRIGEGVPNYMIVNSTDATSESTDYAYVVWGRTDRSRNSSLPDTLMVYAKYLNDNTTRTVYIRAQDPNTSEYKIHAKLKILPSNKLHSDYDDDVTSIGSFPFTWDFTRFDEDDLELIRNDKVYYEERSKINPSNTGYYFSTGYYNVTSYSGHTSDIKEFSPLYGNRYTLQNFVVNDGNGALKTLKQFKGLKICIAGTYYSTKVDRVQIRTSSPYLHFIGGPQEIVLPSMTNAPTNYKIFAKIQGNAGKEFRFKQGSGATQTKYFSGGVEVLSFDATKDGGRISLGFENALIYWIAASTEEKPVYQHPTSGMRAATYSYGEDLNITYSGEANPGLKAYVASSFSSNSVNLKEAPETVKSGTGLVLKSTSNEGDHSSCYMIACGKNLESYSSPAPLAEDENYLKPSVAGETIQRFEGTEGQADRYTNFLLSKTYVAYDENTGQTTTESGPTTGWLFLRVNGVSEAAPANMSYLHVPGTLRVINTNYSAARRAGEEDDKPASKNMLFINFIDDPDDLGTTDISAVSNDGVAIDNDAWYTLQGVRVSAPTKGGIYIHNGRKVVIK